MHISDRYQRLNAAVYPWFQDQWQRFLDLHQRQRLPHALLLNGMPGLGKAQLAQAMAAYVMCHHPSSDRACGHCRSCQLLQGSGHPDLYFLQPEEAGKVIKVDQVRHLTEFMHNTAQQGGYRVVILQPAEAMNTSAANALLKNLEEPGQDTLLILVSHQAGQVLATIKSRCQRLDCYPPAATLAVPWLAQSLEIDADKADQLLAIAHGAPLAALAFKQEGLQTLRAEFLVALRELLKQTVSPLEAALKFDKTDIIQLLGWLQGLLADIIRILMTHNSATIRNSDMQKMLAGVAKHSTLSKVYDLVDKVQEERLGLMFRQNPNKQLLLEDILIDWSALVRPESRS